MVMQLTSNFTFQSVFEQAQHKTQLRDDMNLLTIHSDGPRNSATLKTNDVFIPSVFDIKFICEIARKVISRILGVFAAHRMQSMNVDCGHNFYNLHLAASSLVPVVLSSQPSGKPAGQ